jgi:hypothetical protein
MTTCSYIHDRKFNTTSSIPQVHILITTSSWPQSSKIKPPLALCLPRALQSASVPGVCHRGGWRRRWVGWVVGGASSSCDAPSSSCSLPWASSSSSSSLSSLNVGVLDEDLVAGARCDDDDLAACEVPGTEMSVWARVRQPACAAARLRRRRNLCMNDNKSNCLRNLYM